MMQVGFSGPGVCSKGYVGIVLGMVGKGEFEGNFFVRMWCGWILKTLGIPGSREPESGMVCNGC